MIFEPSGSFNFSGAFLVTADEEAHVGSDLLRQSLLGSCVRVRVRARAVRVQVADHHFPLELRRGLALLPTLQLQLGLHLVGHPPRPRRRGPRRGLVPRAGRHAGIAGGALAGVEGEPGEGGGGGRGGSGLAGHHAPPPRAFGGGATPTRLARPGHVAALCTGHVSRLGPRVATGTSHLTMFWARRR